VLIPRLSYTHQTPWQVTDPNSELFYDKSVGRLRASLTASGDPARGLNLMGGVETHYDHAYLNDPRLIGFQTLFGDRQKVAYSSVALYSQILYRNFIANLTLGARYEYHQQFGSSFVPRVGVTKSIGPVHFKVLYSQAFRAPAIENINIEPTIKPERTHNVEAELGWQITRSMLVTVNGFWVAIENPIIYDVTNDFSMEQYRNGTRSATAGMEAEYRFNYSWGTLAFNYSFYSAAGEDKVDLYRVPGHDDVLLGMPAHKVTLHANFELYRDWVALGVRGAFLSERWGYLTADLAGNPILGREPPSYLLDLMLRVRHIGLKKLDLAVGVVNLLDDRNRVLQPYNSGHAPLPLGSREFFVRLAYNVAAAP
jgi:outer membrane cobalamin receptor